MKYLIPAILLVALFITLFSIYRTKRYTRLHQVSTAIIAALILLYFLYTCKSDDPV